MGRERKGKGVEEWNSSQAGVQGPLVQATCPLLPRPFLSVSIRVHPWRFLYYPGVSKETPAHSQSVAAARVKELRELLNRANRAYYADNQPFMSDPEFDRLLAELAKLEQEHPDLDDPESPTHRVGGEPIQGFETFAHALPMLSIDNTYEEATLREWYARVLRGLG